MNCAVVHIGVPYHCHYVKLLRKRVYRGTVGLVEFLISVFCDISMLIIMVILV